MKSSSKQSVLPSPQTKFPVVTLIDNIRSAHNVGSILRTSDAVGVHKVLLSGITSTPDNKKVQKTALGAEKSVNWEHTWSTKRAVEQLKSEGYTLYAVERTNKAISYETAHYDLPACFVFGNEVSGVEDEILDLVDHHISIPMRGKKESLNVSVSYGIILYDILRKVHAEQK